MSDDQVLLALKDVVDPELGVNIVDLGLVYRAEWTREGIVVEMTMTTPTCPIGEMMSEQAEAALRRRFPDVRSVRIHLLWDPPWSPDLITEEGRRALGCPDPTDARQKTDKGMASGSGWKQ
jgi:metal-sulfur cluster biosynthetic enzyme